MWRLMHPCSGGNHRTPYHLPPLPPAQDTYEVYELLPVLLLGVVGGLLGAGFVSLTAQLGAWRKAVLWPR